MKIESNIWHLITRKLTHQIDRDGDEELKQELNSDSSLHKACEIVDHSQVSFDAQLVQKSMNRTWEKIATGMQKEDKSNKHLYVKIKRYVAAAACVALILTTGFITHMFLDKTEILSVVNHGNLAYLIALPDSSKVWLGSGAKLEYPDNMATHKREVTLEGEAFFEVKKDNGRPFKVSTDIVEITVLGTRFDVRTNKNSQTAEVILESGSVKLAEQGNLSENIILKPGERGTVSKLKGIEVCNVDVHLYTAWKDDYLNIESLMLGDVIFMLSQRYHVPIKINGDALKKEIFSGRFDKDQSLEEILDAISLLIPLHYQKKPDGTYLIAPQ